MSIVFVVSVVSGVSIVLVMSAAADRVSHVSGMLVTSGKNDAPIVSNAFKACLSRPAQLIKSEHGPPHTPKPHRKNTRPGMNSHSKAQPNIKNMKNKQKKQILMKKHDQQKKPDPKRGKHTPHLGKTTRVEKKDKCRKNIQL